jgi:hypothetical protein
MSFKKAKNVAYCTQELNEKKTYLPENKVHQAPLTLTTNLPSKNLQKPMPQFECGKTEGQKMVQKNLTRIVVKCNCGFGNTLYLRGQGIQGLNWDKGTPLKNTKSDEWVWECEKPFSKAEVKIVLNDKQYECGANHIIEYSKSYTFIPNF